MMTVTLLEQSLNVIILHLAQNRTLCGMLCSSNHLITHFNIRISIKHHFQNADELGAIFLTDFLL